VRILKLHETQSSELHTGTETTLASNCSRNNPNLKTGRKGKRNKGNGLAATEEFRVIIVKLQKRPNDILNKMVHVYRQSKCYMGI
jgi:hypothetical protein